MKLRYHVGDQVLFTSKGRVGIERGEYSARVTAVKTSDHGGVSYHIHFDKPIIRHWELGRGQASADSRAS